MSTIHEVPVFRGTPTTDTLCKNLQDHGVVVIEDIHATASLAAAVEVQLGLDHGNEAADGPFLLHLSAELETTRNSPWVDYLVYSKRFRGCPLRAKKMVAEAARRWHAAGKPAYYLARLNS